MERDIQQVLLTQEQIHSRIDELGEILTKEYDGKDPIVETVHAGLECGLLMKKMPGLDAVSFGPDLIEIHSTRERMSIASTERIWKFLLGVLKAL